VDWIRLAQGPVAGCYEHGNEPSCSIKGREFSYLSDYWLLKNESAPWSWLV
jgi:hypothetical protein